MHLKRKLTAVLLIFAILSGSFSRLFIYAGFQLNQKYIAANLCVNRDKPWLHCNGHCYFMKKIQQADENDKKQEAKDNLTKMEVSFFQEAYRVSFIEPVILTTNNTIFSQYTYQYSSSYIDTIFRPPKQAA